MFKVMERELDDIGEAEKWKIADEDDDRGDDQDKGGEQDDWPVSSGR